MIELSTGRTPELGQAGRPLSNQTEKLKTNALTRVLGAREGPQSPAGTDTKALAGSRQRVIRDTADFGDLWRKYHSQRARTALRSPCQFEIASISWQRNGIFLPVLKGLRHIPGALFFGSC